MDGARPLQRSGPARIVWVAAGLALSTLVLAHATLAESASVPAHHEATAMPVGMPDLTSADTVRMMDRSMTLGRTDAVTFTLHTSDADWTGTAEFSVDAWQWRPSVRLRARVPITVPAIAFAQFRATLQSAPLIDTLAAPTPTATPDVYTSFEILFDNGAERIVRIFSFISTFTRLQRSPWAVESGGWRAFTTDRSVDQAVGILYPYLRYDILEELIDRSEQPPVSDPTPTPDSVYFPLCAAHPR